jgi:hypothetical protein
MNRVSVTRPTGNDPKLSHDAG